MKYTLCLFYEDIYLSKFNDNSEKKLYNELIDLGNNVIIEGMKQKQNIPTQIIIYKGFLKEMSARRKKGLGIFTSNHKLICASIGALIKLNQYHEHELTCCLKRKVKI